MSHSSESPTGSGTEANRLAARAPENARDAAVHPRTEPELDSRGAEPGEGSSDPSTQTAAFASMDLGDPHFERIVRESGAQSGVQRSQSADDHAELEPDSSQTAVLRAPERTTKPGGYDSVPAVELSADAASPGEAFGETVIDLTVSAARPPSQAAAPGASVNVGVEIDTDLVECPACGFHNPTEYRFCGKCAAPLKDIDAASAFRDPLIGALVGGRYRIIDRLGAGGMGSVYKVEHVQIGKIAAMKLLHGELSKDADMVRRFNREARAVSRLHNPHTVTVYDYGQSSGLVYLVMEYLEGNDLGEVLEAAGRLSPEQTSKVIAQAAASIAEAHALGIVHRDLKPQNLFLCQASDAARERIKVLDFGLAKLTEGQHDDLTATESVMGTPYYMSPEQIENKKLDHRTDIYSLGAVAYTLMCGVPPFRHSSPIGVLRMHLKDPVPSLKLGDSAPAALDRVIQRAMAKDAARRYGSVLEFAEAFEEAVSSLSQPTRRPTGRGVSLKLDAPAAPGAEEEDAAAIREEFERFARGLRFRRATTVLGVVAVVLFTAFALIWGVGLGNWTERRRESENNNDLGRSDHIALGVPVTGTIGAPDDRGQGDRDVFQLESSASQDRRISAEVSGVPGVDLVLEFAYSDGNVVLASDSGRIGEGERLDGFVPRDRVFYVVVRPLSVEGVEVTTNPTEPYTLLVRERPALLGEEAEPNGSRFSAREIRLGQSASGAIGYPQDTDMFALPDVLPGRTRIELEGAPGVDLSMMLQGSDGVTIELVDRYGVGHGERIQLPADTTPYEGGYLHIAGAPDDASHLVYVLTMHAPDEDAPVELPTGRLTAPTTPRLNVDAAPEGSAEALDAAHAPALEVTP